MMACTCGLGFGLCREHARIALLAEYERLTCDHSHLQEWQACERCYRAARMRQRVEEARANIPCITCGSTAPGPRWGAGVIESLPYAPTAKCEACLSAGPVAQPAEHRSPKPEDAGSTPASPATPCDHSKLPYDQACARCYTDDGYPVAVMSRTPAQVESAARAVADAVRLTYFDRLPTHAITAVQVRQMRGADPNKPPPQGWSTFYREVLSGLLTHQGLSSTARSVVEAALE
jgi:hypothetical protein